MQESLHFEGSDFEVYPDELSEDLTRDLTDCGAPGPADGAVAYVRSNYTVTGKPEDCAAYLRGYGAWEDDELADHDANLDRLVWLTGCSFAEGEPAYFATY